MASQSLHDVKNIVQYCRIAASQLNTENISFFANIPSSAVMKFLNRFSSLEQGEKKLAFIDSSVWGSGKQGALVTDRGVYSIYGNDCVSSMWKDINSVFISNRVVSINDRNAFICGYDEDETRLFYHMVYDIFRSIRGSKIRLTKLSSIELPQKCAGCSNTNLSKVLDVPVYGEERLTGKGELAQSYSLGAALMGSIILSILAASVAMNAKNRDVLFEFSIPFCDSCFSNLSENEKDFSSFPLVVASDIPGSFYGNRFFSIELDGKYFELWFRNEIFANDINIQGKE